MKNVKIGLATMNGFPTYTMKYGRALAYFEYSSYGIEYMMKFAVSLKDVRFFMINILDESERKVLIEALIEAGVSEGRIKS